MSDLFTNTIYKNHFYVHSYTEVLNEIDSITFEDVKNGYFEILNNSKKALVLVGDTDFEFAEKVLN